MSATVGAANASRGLEVAVANLQDYCNGKFYEFLLNKFSCEVNFLTLIYNPSELENRLLSRFDAASQKRELSTMAECAKILSQVWNFLFQFISLLE